MNLAYVTTYDASKLQGGNEWSGTGYYIAQALKHQGIPLDYIGPLSEPFGVNGIQKAKRLYHKLVARKNYQTDPNPVRLRSYANQIRDKLARSPTQLDIVFSATVNPIAYLECRQPIVFWGDATGAGLIDFYPQYDNLCQESLDNWHMMEKLALEKCRLAIYASDWAAQTAIEYYDADPNRVKVIPFGANIDRLRTFGEIKELIKARPAHQCKLLFLGVDWYRKGGDIALKVAEELNNLGLDTELTIVGCQPIIEGILPSFVKSLGYINKSSIGGKDKIDRLIAESHFLIVPSRAECYGVVFCEANSLGVPCLSTKVGGIPSIIKSNINGQLFDPEHYVGECCNYIINLFATERDYQNLALSAFHEYESRLNWRVAGRTVKQLLTDLI